VVIATPTGPAARLLRPHDDEAAALLEQMAYSSVGVVTFAFPSDDLVLSAEGTGVLVPPGTLHRRGPLAGQRYLTTALTFLDRKWPHLAVPGITWLRASVGRIDDVRLATMDDDAVLATVAVELEFLLGDVPAPIDASVTRWTDSLPQYRVNHLLRVGGIESGVARLDGIEIAGAAYRGVGVAACVASGREAATRILEHLARG
jgi:oxygen-dependent protoporphyrinogen oxidase